MKVMIGFERSSTRPPTVRRAFGAGRTRSVSTPSWMIAVRLRKATGRRPAWKGVGATMRSASPKTIAMVAFFACTRNFSSSEGALELGIEADVAPVRAVVVLGVGDLPRLRKDLAEENRFAPARMPDDHVRREAALAQSERRLRRRAAPNEIGLGADRRREDARRRSPYTAPAHQRNAGELAAGDGRERSAIVTARRHRVSDQAELRREVVVHEQKAGHPGEGPSRRLLPAPERPGDLVRERLHDVGEHGALAGPDESFDGHPGDQPQAFEPSELALRERDPDDVIRGAGALVGREVGGDAADDAAELRRRALVEGREAQGRGLPDADLIDVLRRELRLDRQHIGFRYDQHDGLSGRDHPAHRVDGRLVHHPVLRRSDIDALQLVLGRDLALDELGNLALDLAQILGNLAAQILIDLQDLQLDFGNLALGLCSRRDELAALALEARGVALKRRHALDLHEVLAPEIPDALELLADQLGFALLRRDLAGEALDLLLELRDALPELRLLAGPCALAELEEVALAGHRPGQLGVAGPGEKLRREEDGVDVVALRLKPGEAGLELVQALDHDGEVRLRDGLVEPHHDIARLDLVAVARPQFADDTAGRVLHLLDVRVDDEAARRDHRAGQLGRRRKPADAAGEKRHDRSTPASALGRCAITTTMRPRARAPRIAWVSACSPSASRLEFGSSNTSRNGSR